MASDIKPLAGIRQELKALAGSGASGFVFLMTSDGQAASLRLRNGVIEEVTMGALHSDEAVARLHEVSGARLRFQPSVMAAIPSKYAPLGAAALAWLLAADAADEAAQPAAPARPRAQLLSAAQRKAVEDIALNYLGPIAGFICNEAFDDAADAEQALGRIATNLAERSEADRFLAEARAALLRLRT